MAEKREKAMKIWVITTLKLMQQNSLLPCQNHPQCNSTGDKSESVFEIALLTYSILNQYVWRIKLTILCAITRQLFTICILWSLNVLRIQFYIVLSTNSTLVFDFEHSHHLFYSTQSSSLSKPGAYITHNATRLPTVQLEIRVCYASSG